MIDISGEMITILMFTFLLIGIFMGHPLTFILGGLAIVFGYLSWGPGIFPMFINRIYGLMDNYVLLAIPLFIFMAQFLDTSGVTVELFKSLRYLLGPIRGGVGVTVVIVSTIFAACTGIVGASIVTMGLLALPMMMSYGYQKELSCGSIAAAGTLGILIPPSIMLVLMASEASLSVGKLFAGAVFPGILLSVLYLGYIMIRCWLNPELGPALSKEEKGDITNGEIFWMVMKSLMPPMILIVGVLGSIFTGVATPTEASGVGAFMAFWMVVGYGKFTWASLKDAIQNTAQTSTMVVFLLCGATCFTGAFLGAGGEQVVTNFIVGLGLGKWGTFWVMMAIVFVLGMFLDWIGIVLICFPIFLPMANALGFDMIWFVVMIAVNLQASFLTPPFGYALFYIKGVAPEGVELSHVYKGILPFVGLMLTGLIICASFPQLVLWLPSMVVN